MELKLVNGSYVAGEYQGLARVNGLEELRQRVYMKLCARRGGFLPFPDYGSRLCTLHTIPPGRRENAARQFVAEALAEEKELELESLELEDLAGESIGLSLTLIYRGGDRLVIETWI